MTLFGEFFQEPYILRPKDRIYSVFLVTHTISQGRSTGSLRHKNVVLKKSKTNFSSEMILLISICGGSL